MNLKRRWSEKTRLMLTLELAVVLPAAALVIASIVHLKSIERDRAVEAAIQRDFSQVLAISEKDFDQRAYELGDDVAAEYPAPGEACAETLDRILAAHPYIVYAFVYDPKSGLSFRAQQDRMKDAQFQSDTDDFHKMLAEWLPVDHGEDVQSLRELEKRGIRYKFFDNWAGSWQKRIYESGAIFLIGPRSGGNSDIGGFVFDPDYLRQKFFPEMLDTVLARNANEGRNEKNPAVMMIHPQSSSTPMVASSGWDGGPPEVERDMQGAFPGLTLAIKLHGTTLAAIGQHFMRMNFLILGVISVLLAGGLVLTHRNVAKEIALAKLKADFVSNVSHELRTPLSLIRLYAETLEMGRLTSPEKYQEYYSIIRKESERLTALINNILDFSRIEAGRKEYEFRDTDLRELVRATMDSYRYQIEQQGFTLEEKIDENVPPMKVDREAIARSLVNLVNNALKYSTDHKYVAVNLFRQNGSVKLQVTDHGIGIPVEEQAKIFEKFYRVGDPLVHNTKGSGLGLSLVRHIARAHGGDISVESSPGAGSKFTIELPVEGAARSEQVSAS